MTESEGVNESMSISSDPQKEEDTQSIKYRNKYPFLNQGAGMGTQMGAYSQYLRFRVGHPHQKMGLRKH